MKKTNIRPVVFWTPMILLVAGLVISLAAGDSFFSVLNKVNTALLSNFGWLYSLTTLIVLLVCFAVMLSPFGKIKVGGKDAEPKMKAKDIFAIVLCSIVGIGMVTWGTAEIMAHYTAPLSTLGLEPYSDGAADFAMETVLLHWTFPAYGLYALPSVFFAFIFYNMKRPFSVREFLYPVFGKKMEGKISGAVDIVCVFTLLCGMVGTIGTAVLSLLGGITHLSGGGIGKTPLAIAVLVAVIVVTFVVSSVTGVMKGIRILSNMNLYFFAFLAVFTLICGPTAFIFNYGVEGAGNMITHFFSSMLRTNAVSSDDWSYWWSIFYWAAYMTWAPISAMFIGKVCYGQTFRRILSLTLVWPSIFTAVWMSIFSGTSMHFERAGYGVADAYAKGYEYTVYAVFEHLPFPLLITVVFLCVACISVVTASDSAADSLAGLVTAKEQRGQNEGKKTWVKVIVGLVIGVSTFIIVVYSDISGVKMISNIGAFPALWIELLTVAGIVRIMKDPQKYDENKKDYDEQGRY